MAQFGKDTFDLIGMRKRLGFNQTDMAARMGLKPRAYFTLEQKPEAINARHVMLAQMVSLEVAVARKDRSLTDTHAAELAIMFCALPL